MGDSAVRPIPATASKASAPEPTRTGLSAETLQRAVLDNLTYIQARLPELATAHDWYMALAYTVRDRMLERWQATVRADAQRDVKVVCYLSAEFLIGPQLRNNLLSLDIAANARAAMAALDQDLDELLALEEEPGLGNGGLGRLAACYMDSLATLELPAIGYGIRYEFGIFDQQIRGGAQVEVTDKWLQKGNPWEIVRTDLSCYVRFGGHSETFTDADGHQRVRWVPAHMVKGVPCDTPVLGYHVGTCNTLRLWKSEAVESFDFEDFNTSDYYGAVNDKVISETISKVLYPNDEPEAGKRLRLAQQLGMQRGHAVHGVAAHGREVRHAHAFLAGLIDERHAGDPRLIAWIPLSHIGEEAAIDFVDDLQRARQEVTEQRQTPGLERFREQGVIGVGERTSRQIPGLVPWQHAFIHQQPHELRHGD